MVMADRLSALPDGLLSLILSRLPIRDAVRCSILSTRWRLLYTEMPQLVITPALLTPTGLLPPPKTDRLSMAALENIISHILRSHSSDLHSFLLSNHITNSWHPVLCEFRRQTLCEWLQCVSRKNVQRLCLKCSYNMEIPPPALFSCTRLTSLTLCNYNPTDFPSDFVGFNLLTQCTLIGNKMTDASLARFLLLCPLLHKFDLMNCAGLQRPVITALNVTDLFLHGCHGCHECTVNCPNLKTLKVFREDLKVNGMEFQELSPSITGLEMEIGSNLIGLSLQSMWASARTISANRFLELMGTLRSLKVLSMRSLMPLFPGEKWIDVPLFKLLSRLPNLERFHLLGELIWEAPERERIPPSSMSPLPNLQLVEIQIKYDETELRLLGCLLQIAPALKEVKLKRKPAVKECNNERYNLFLEKWQALRKGREEGNITETIPEFNFRF